MLNLMNTAGIWQIFKNGKQVGQIDGNQIDLNDILFWLRDGNRSNKDTSDDYRWCKNFCDTKKPIQEFYIFKDGTVDYICKECRLRECDIEDVTTFFPLMKIYDIPYIADEWSRLKDRFANYYNSKERVFGTYLSKMKLFGWRSYGWKDSPYLYFNEKIPQELIEYIEGE